MINIIITRAVMEPAKMHFYWIQILNLRIKSIGFEYRFVIYQLTFVSVVFLLHFLGVVNLMQGLQLDCT